MTFVWAATQGHLVSLPVDLWVVLHEPGETEDNVELSEVSDSKRGSL